MGLFLDRSNESATHYRYCNNDCEGQVSSIQGPLYASV